MKLGNSGHELAATYRARWRLIAASVPLGLLGYDLFLTFVFAFAFVPEALVVFFLAFCVPKACSQFLVNSGDGPLRTIGPLIAMVSVKQLSSVNTRQPNTIPDPAADFDSEYLSIRAYETVDRFLRNGWQRDRFLGQHDVLASELGKTRVKPNKGT